MMLALKFTSLTITLATALFVYRYTHRPSFNARNLHMLAIGFLLIGVPSVILLVLLALQGKWAGVFMICSLISVFVTGSAAAYQWVKHTTKGDPFTPALMTGMFAMMLAGGPLAAYLLP